MRTAKRQMLIGIALVVCILAFGCGQGAPAKSVQATDPSGLGMTPQQRLDQLKANNTLPERYKARKIQLLQAQIDQSKSTPISK